MIKVSKFGTVKFDSVVYLSHNLEPELDNEHNRLLLYFRAYETYTVISNHPTLLRKVSKGMPIIEYYPVNSGLIEFISSTYDERLYLKYHD